MKNLIERAQPFYKDGDTIRVRDPNAVLEPALFGEMYLLSNATATVIETADVWHTLSLTEIVAGSLNGWTYADGVRGDDITAYATSNAGARTKVTTTAAHNLAVGDCISITGTTNYNNLFEVMEIVDANNFTIDKAWDTNDDATGTYARGGALTAGSKAAGFYSAEWDATMTPQTNNHIFTMGFMVNKTPCNKCRARQRLGTAGDYNSVGGTAILEIVTGDKVSFILKNVGGTGNCTIRHGNVNFHRI